MEKDLEKTLGFRLSVLLRLWYLSLPPLVVLVGGLVFFWSGGLAFALALSLFAAFAVFCLCACLTIPFID